MTAWWNWLMLPLSGASVHHLEPALTWHGRLMVLSWAVLLPAGALAARYFKVLPWQDWPHVLDHKFWWHTHRWLQWSGMLMASAGAWLGWQALGSDSPMARLHGLGGWVLMLAGWLQVLGGWLRGSKGGPGDVQLRGDHYDMTKRRIWFEKLHKGLGWLAVLWSMALVMTGLLLADAPRWMPLILTVWWLLLAGLAGHWQRQGRCIDTYQAIWGPDAAHPGNQRTPIGWGVHRPSWQEGRTHS